MTLTPSTVRETTFRVVRRGYDTREVDAFLAAVQTELADRSAVATVSAAVVVEESPDPIGAAPSADAQPDLAVEVLRLAQQTAHQLLADAREQARALHEAATAEADRLRGEAQRQRRDDVARLEQCRDELQAEVQSLAGLRSAHRAELVGLLEQQLRQAQGDGLHVVRARREDAGADHDDVEAAEGARGGNRPLEDEGRVA